MNGRYWRLIGGFIVLSCLLVLAFSSALAAPADATEVVVNGITLDVSTPYWKNGEAAASATVPAGGWNAYFNAATSTLTLQDAQIDVSTPLSSGGTREAFIEIIGNGILILNGNNTLFSSEKPAFMPDSCVGVYASGDIVVEGSGELTIDIESDNDIYGFMSRYQDIYLNGGTISILIASGDLVGGIVLLNHNATIDGALVTINVKARSGSGVSINGGTFTLESGSLHVQVESSTYNASGVSAGYINLNGGTLQVSATGPSANYGVGLTFEQGPLVASGGYFTVSGTSQAMGCGENRHPIEKPEEGMEFYVSTMPDGSNKTQWFSRADGDLVYSASGPSLFRYVEIRPITPTTGDGQAPWFWLGVAGLCLLLGTAGIAGIKRLRV